MLYTIQYERGDYRDVYWATSVGTSEAVRLLALVAWYNYHVNGSQITSGSNPFEIAMEN